MGIENEVAYDAAIRRNIRMNAAKTRQRNWYAAHPDAERLAQFLTACGEFDDRWTCGATVDTYADENHGCGNPRCRIQSHPALYHLGEAGNALRHKMSDARAEWGGLTDKQTDLVRSLIERGTQNAARAAERRAARREQDLASTHIGTVGERREFTLTVNRVLSFDGQYGTTYINLCKDEAGNVVVCKGSVPLQNLTEAHETQDDDAPATVPATIRIKATVKAHEERDGVKQTLIFRPKFID